MIAVPNVTELVGVRAGREAGAESGVKGDGVRGGRGEGREDGATRGAKRDLAEGNSLGGRGWGSLEGRGRVGKSGSGLRVQIISLELTVVLTAGLVALAAV